MASTLYDLRRAAVLTQQELAEAAGLDATNLSQIELGLQRPRISTIRKLAHALGVAPTVVQAAAEEAYRQRNAAGAPS